MTNDSRTESRPWYPAIWGAIAVTVGVLAFWAFGLTAVDQPTASEPIAPDPIAADPEPTAPDSGPKPGAATKAVTGVQEGAAAVEGHTPRLFTDYGFRVSLDPSWTVETGTAGIRVLVADERFFVLRAPAPVRLGSTAEPPGNQEVVVSRRIAGTDILCTVDPGTSDTVRKLATDVCATVTDQGGIGVLTDFKCESDPDIDLTATGTAVEGVREEIIECFTVAHRGEIDMAVGQASVGVEPSPEGVPLVIVVGGDVPTEAAFNWLKGCMTDLFRRVEYTKQSEGDGMLRCEFNWSLE